MKNEKKIECPNCGHEIDVNAILYNQLENDFKKQYSAQLADENKKYEAKYTKLNEEKKKIKKDKSEIEDKIKREVSDRLKDEKISLEKKITQRIQEEESGRILVLQKEIEEKSKQLKEYNKAKAEIEKIKREKNELQESFEVETTKKINEKLQEVKVKFKKEAEQEFEEKIIILENENLQRKEENTILKKKEIELLKKEQQLKESEENIQLEVEKKILERRDEIAKEVRYKEDEKNELKFREYKKHIDDQNKLIEEMKRKAEQGSMQMQGEIQELALEDMLNSLFPFDRIEEVPKGVRGADVIQTVINPMQQSCGKIIYESKRTKSFSNDWTEKLKEDQRNQQADISIIITETMPKDLDRFGIKNGVWICSFIEAKSVAFILREMILKTHSIKQAEENKGDKKELLYKYLISEEFKQRVEAIVEGFSGMKSDLDKEKRALQKIWKTREKQIEKVISNTIDFYGSIKGIAGTSIQTVKALELPVPEEELEFEN